MSNGFGADLKMKSLNLIFIRLCLAPVIFVSVVFRCLSFVLIVLLLRLFSIIPILWILWISNNTRQKVGYKKSLFFNSCQAPLQWTVRFLFEQSGYLLTGPVLEEYNRIFWFRKEKNIEDLDKVSELRLSRANIITKMITGHELYKVDAHEKKRTYLFLFDAISSFLSHGLVLIIIIILWEATPILDQNLKICTFPWIKSHISIICGGVISLSAINCLLCFFYFKSF